MFLVKACGLIVEYNPLHNGHLYHIKEARNISQAECMIAVMSGSFLQRGEPAIIDKYHRTKTALASGVDIVLELPYPYAVQSSKLFAKGSVHTLNEIGVSNICFGSEQGTIDHFINSYHMYQKHIKTYEQELKHYLARGYSFPQASKHAYEKIGLTEGHVDLSQPNNILGFSYVQTILDDQLSIKPLTIKRTKSQYHDQTIDGSIASATSIRKQLMSQQQITTATARSMPSQTIDKLNKYKKLSSVWHHWQLYFPYLHYRVMTMSSEELSLIHGIEEGLENRIKRTALEATSFKHWMELVKTKRYTWTRLQRTFVHILTNTTKEQINFINNIPSVPYIRLLGLTKVGQAYLRHVKKHVDVPLFSELGRYDHLCLELEERASDAYYSALPPVNKIQFRRQELQPPIFA